jgi:hypothetical protein
MCVRVSESVSEYPYAAESECIPFLVAGPARPTTVARRMQLAVLIPVHLGASNALQAVLSVDGELWVDGGGAASTVLRRCRLEESIDLRSSSGGCSSRCGGSIGWSLFGWHACTFWSRRGSSIRSHGEGQPDRAALTRA